MNGKIFGTNDATPRMILYPLLRNVNIPAKRSKGSITML
jgi:hypothetical protein